MKILIVDDNADDRRLLRYIIERKGHEAVEAGDGLEGLRMAKIHRPDLIISDALMPLMDGFQFLRAAKGDELIRSTPFIFYSAIYKADKDVDLAIELGAEAYIIKPKEPAEFWEEVEIIIQNRKNEKIITPELIQEDDEYLKKYSQVVATKLEEKVRELENALAFREKAEIERRQAEKENKKLEDQLRHAQKMEAVGTLAGGIAHDFNNILNVIMGYGSLVMNKLKADSREKDQMKEVLAAAERAANLTKRLLVFSRKQVVEVKLININELILGLQKMLVQIIRENIELDLDLSTGQMNVMADAGQIEQVLMNLATNARDAMPEGGHLTIGTRLQEITEEYVAAYGYGTPGIYALITVADTGQGMDEETRKKIFEPFFTTKGIGEGTGLGLAISYGIIKQHSGYINVYSEPGQGTLFKIYLPLIEKPAALEIKTEDTVSVKGGNETILVAEDDASVRKLTKVVLESYGYTVITAEDGEDAVTKFTENREKIELVILDMIMPKKSGKEVSEVIRKESPLTKILFASGYTMDTIKTQEIKEAGFDFIHKPFLPKDIVKKAREILDR